MSKHTEVLNAAKHYVQNYLLDEYKDASLCCGEEQHKALVALFDAIKDAEKAALRAPTTNTELARQLEHVANKCKVEYLESERSALQHDLTEEHEKWLGLTVQWGQAVAERDALRHDLRALLYDNTQLMQTNADLAVKLDEMRAKFTQASYNHAEAIEQWKEAEGKVKALSAEAEKDDKEIECLHQRVEQLESENRSFRAEQKACEDCAPDTAGELTAWREWGRHLGFAAGQIAGTWTVVQDDAEQNSTGQPVRSLWTPRIDEQNAAPQAGSLGSEVGAHPPKGDSIPGCGDGGPAVAAPRAWIATHENGRVLHFSTHDGWTVEQVVGEQNAAGQEAPTGKAETPPPMQPAPAAPSGDELRQYIPDLAGRVHVPVDLWQRIVRAIDGRREYVQDEATVNGPIGELLSAINSEEELSGPMPDEMWDAIKADREACMEAMRIAVRMTKEGIRDRYLAAFGRAAMNNGEGK